jgi:allantoicase
MSDRANDFHYLPDLASRALGGSVMWANDELFAERENLIKAAPPTFAPHVFGHKGQIMDGWESRRRRAPGHDEAIVRLGAAGIVRGVVVDTSHFTGNYPPEISVEGYSADGYPDAARLLKAVWTTLVPRSPINGDTANEFGVDDPHRYTHVKLTMYPDGGVARLRVRGVVVADPTLLPAVFDLAALENGGRIVGASNVFYSSPGNLILPGTARVMGEGWETSRRRDDGNDWVDVELAAPATLQLAELDTSCFVGNSPGWARLSTPDGREVLPRTALLADTRHRFVLAPADPVDRVRLDIYPDGGLARLRLIGTPTDAGWASLRDQFERTQPERT